MDFEDVRLRIYCALRAEDAYVVGFGVGVDYFRCGANDAKNTVLRIDVGKVVLLYCAQSLRESGVARQNNERASQIKKKAHRLQRVGVHRLKTS